MTEVGFEAYVGSLHRGWPSATSQVRVHLNLRRQQSIPQHFCHRSQRYKKILGKEEGKSDSLTTANQ